MTILDQFRDKAARATSLTFSTYSTISTFVITTVNRKKEYDKEIWYDWLFYTFLASINLLLKFKNRKAAP